MREYNDGTIGNCFCTDSEVDFGGHSRRSLTSSLAESPVTCDTTLELRDGELAEKRTKGGRIFYGCSNYPACDFLSWKKPVPTPCPNCGGLLVEANRRQYQCIRCEHRFDRDAEPEVTENVGTLER